MLRVTGCVAVLVAVLLAASEAPVFAGNTGGAKCGVDSCDATAVNEQSGGGSGGQQPDSPVTCAYEALNLPRDQAVYDPNGNPIPTDGTGAWYEKVCSVNGKAIYGYGVYLGAANLRDEALSQLSLPHPTIRLNPDAKQPQLVNLATWLWVDPAMWREQTATAAVPGLTVTVTARPTRVVWEMGTGDVVTCAGPGTPYDSSRPASEQSTDCSYTFRRSSEDQPNEAYRVTATVEWAASWTQNGALPPTLPNTGPAPAPAVGGGGSLGTLRQGATVSVPVAEAESINRSGTD